MKLLIITSTLPASDTDKVPSFVKDQAIWFSKQYPDMKISVLAPHNSDSQTKNFTAHANYDEYRFHYFLPGLEKLAGHGIVPALKQNPFNYLLVPFLFIGEFRALLKLSRQLRPDVLYAHWFTPQGIVAGLVSARTNIPFVYTSHSSDVSFLHKIPWLGPLLVRHFTHKASAVSVVSRRSLEKLQTFFTPEAWQRLHSKISIIPMGVSLNQTNSSSKKTQSQQILFLGRLAEKKGVQYLLPAFNQIYKKYPKASLVIAGDGPWLKQLTTQATGLGLPKNVISFTGFVSGEQKENTISQSDIYVVPSIIADNGDAEGLPVSLMEGLAAGKICVATNESGADDILSDGKDGFLVEQKNTEALAGAIEKALALSTQQRSAMNAAARQTAKQFAWPEIARRHYEFLLQKGIEAS